MGQRGFPEQQYNKKQDGGWRKETDKRGISGPALLMEKEKRRKTISQYMPRVGKLLTRLRLRFQCSENTSVVSILTGVP